MFFKKPIKETFPNYKSLRDYTDEELFEILQKNTSTDLVALAGICSEVLRRQLTSKKD